MGRIGVGPAKRLKRAGLWRTGGLGGPEALLSMGTGFPKPFPSARFQSRELAVQVLPWGGEGGWWGWGGQVLQSAAWGHWTATGIITTVMGCG